MTGPQQQRLQQYLLGTNRDQLDRATNEWQRAADALTRVAGQLRLRSLPGEQPGKVGALTGEAMARAFRSSAEAMTSKAEELLRGREALRAAGEAITAAEATRDDLAADSPGERPSPMTFTGPMRPKDIRAEADRNAAIAAWDAEQERRERQARMAADQMDATFTDSSATLRTIHRETPPEDRSHPGPGSPGTTPGGNSPTGPTAPGPAHTPGPGGGGIGHPAHGSGHTAGTPTGPGTGSDGPPTGGTSTTLGVPQGPTTGAAAPPVLAGPTGAGTAASPVSPASTVSSAAAGAALGGLALGGGMIAAGTSSPTGLKAGPAPSSAAGGQGARPIGASSTRAAGATLGRTTSAIVPGQATAGSQARATGQHGTPRSRSAFAKPTPAAPAGERRIAAPGHPGGSKQGTGAGGTGRRNRDERKQPATPAGYLEQWELEDDAATPGVLD